MIFIGILPGIPIPSSVWTLRCLSAEFTTNRFWTREACPEHEKIVLLYSGTLQRMRFPWIWKMKQLPVLSLSIIPSMVVSVDNDVQLADICADYSFRLPCAKGNQDGRS
jgi:hypothetical protein